MRAVARGFLHAAGPVAVVLAVEWWVWRRLLRELRW